MPLYKTIHTPQDATIGIWRIEEEEDYLKQRLHPNIWQRDKYQNITSIRRQKEWLAVRVLIRELLPKNEVMDIRYDEFGKPSLNQNTRYISITHSKDFAAVILHHHKELGIDIEPIHPKILRLRHKFISEKEALQIEGDDVFKLTLFWSAKETLYKLYGKKKLRFKEHLLIHSQIQTNDSKFETEGYLEASICKESFNLHTKVYYKQIEGSILTYTLANI
ncbi:MAG: 4'-phosphopantetheinyl transferase family protein [Chitinophagales bacterium]